MASSSSSSSTSENEVQVEVDDQCYDPVEELMLLILQQSQQILEAYKSNYEMWRRRRRFIQRNREVGHTRLVNDYFSANPVYPNQIFRKRFPMRKELFLRMVNALENRSLYFQQRDDAARRKGLSSLQKCTAAIRQLAYGVTFDYPDGYLCMGESTVTKCLFKFFEFVVELFGDQYLRRPNDDDVQRLLEMHDKRHGFSDMLGSQSGNGKIVQLHGNVSSPEVMGHQQSWLKLSHLKICGYDMHSLGYSVHVMILTCCTNLPHSGTSCEEMSRKLISHTQYTNGYYLTDEIYPECTAFVRVFPCTEDPKRKLFNKRQEIARKYVERTFELLQFRWVIIRGQTRYWYKKKLKHIMLACIIFHNMIVEDERDDVTNWYEDEDDESV